VALNIKNPKVERLAAEVARVTGETKTQAIKVALEQRRHRLLLGERVDDRRVRVLRFLEEEVWPLVPVEVRAQPMTKEEEAAILGYGPEGV
jgi:antitoxin VapB